MLKISVLGAGMVGRAIAIDLSHTYHVKSFDINEDNLKKLSGYPNIETHKLDFNDFEKLKESINDSFLVMGAVPGFMGYKVLKAVIESKKNIIDISFFPEDAFSLTDLARDKEVTAIVDCGVAPGMGNIILSYHNQRMSVENYECYVGGLPLIRDLPFEYKAPFSPIDVIEEYTRPARYVQNGVIVVKPALSEPEYLHFDNIGTLEAFNTDGLRSLLQTMKIPNMKEKTMRYPGHIKLIQAFKDSGLFSPVPIDFNGKNIKPIEFVSKLLFNKWKLGEEEEEFTVMRIIIEGVEDGSLAKYIYNLYDRYDNNTNISSMARTTGYTATAAANLVINGKFARKGICPPEYLCDIEGNFEFIMNYLQERDVIYIKK